MTRRTYMSMLLIFSLICLQSCEDGWDFDIPGCMNQDAENYDLNATSDNGNCCFQAGLGCIDSIDIDASDFNIWIYFSLALGEIVSISDPENSLDWDLAFKRNHIKTNGGMSGSGDVCAIVDDSQSWTIESFESAQQISNGECQIDDIIEGNIFTFQGCYNPKNHLFEDCVKNPALDYWGSFDSNYYLNVTNYRFFVRDLDGDFVKIWLMSFYDSNGESGRISMDYLFISE